VILVPVRSKRSLSGKAAFECWNKYLKKENISIVDSLAEGLRIAEKEKVIVAAGSLYLAGEILGSLKSSL